jgi:MFS family permease
MGPLVGGALADAAGGRWIFYVNVPVGLLALALAWHSPGAPSPATGRRRPAGGGWTSPAWSCWRPLSP